MTDFEQEQSNIYTSWKSTEQIYQNKMADSVGGGGKSSDSWNRSSDALYKDEISSESIYGTLRIKESKKSAIISHPFGNYAKVPKPGKAVSIPTVPSVHKSADSLNNTTSSSQQKIHQTNQLDDSIPVKRFSHYDSRIAADSNGLTNRRREETSNSTNHNRESRISTNHIRESRIWREGYLSQSAGQKTSTISSEMNLLESMVTSILRVDSDPFLTDISILNPGPLSTPSGSANVLHRIKDIKEKTMSLGRKGSSLIKRRKSSGSLTSTCSGETISSQGEEDGMNGAGNERPTINTTRNGIITNGSVSYATNERRFRESTTSGPNSVDSGFSSFSSSSSATSSSTKRVREITGNKKIKRCKSLTRPRVPPPPPPVPKSSTPVPLSSPYLLDDSVGSQVCNTQKTSIPIPPPLPPNSKIVSELPISSSKTGVSNAKTSSFNDITCAIPNHPQLPRDSIKVATSSTDQAENCNSVSMSKIQLTKTPGLNPEIPTLADISAKPDDSFKDPLDEDIKSSVETSTEETVKPMSTFHSVHRSNTFAPSSMTTPSSFVGLSSLPKSAMKMSALPFGSSTPISQQSVITSSSSVVVEIPKSSSSSMLNSFSESSPGAAKLPKSPSMSSIASSSKLTESAELSKTSELNLASPSLVDTRTKKVLHSNQSPSASDDVRRILSDYSLPRILSSEGSRYSEVRSPSPPPLPTTSPPPLTPSDEEKIIAVKPPPLTPSDEEKIIAVKPEAIEQTKTPVKRAPPPMPPVRAASTKISSLQNSSLEPAVIKPYDNSTMITRTALDNSTMMTRTALDNSTMMTRTALDNSTMMTRSGQDNHQIIPNHSKNIKKSTSKIMTRNKSFTFVRKPFYKLGFMIPEVSAAVEAANSLDASSLKAAISTDASPIKAANSSNASSPKAANSSDVPSPKAANSTDAYLLKLANSSDAPSLKAAPAINAAITTDAPLLTAASYSLDASPLIASNSSDASSISAYNSSEANISTNSNNGASKLSDNCKELIKDMDEASPGKTTIEGLKKGGKYEESPNSSLVENSRDYEKEFVLKLANVSLEEGRHYDLVTKPVLKSANLSLENGGKSKDVEKAAVDVQENVEDNCVGGFEEDSSIKSGYDTDGKVALTKNEKAADLLNPEYTILANIHDKASDNEQLSTTGLLLSKDPAKTGFDFLDNW